MLKWLKRVFQASPSNPPAEFRHASLGLLSGEEGLWSGRVQQHGRDIPFTVAGTEAAPNPHLLEILLGLLTKLPDLEGIAREFLRPPQVPVKPNGFTFQAIELLWPEKPQCFTLVFALEGDPGAVWRAEFANGQPKYSGRDD